MDWQIKPLSRQSLVSGQAFEVGERIVCFLLMGDDGQMQRADISEVEAEKFPRPEMVLGRWTREVKDQKDEAREAKKQMLASTEELFLSLFDDSDDDDAPVADSTARASEAGVAEPDNSAEAPDAPGEPAPVAEPAPLAENAAETSPEEEEPVEAPANTPVAPPPAVLSEREALKQVLALMLERKRILRAVGGIRNGVLLYRHVKNKTEHPVPMADLAPAQILRVQEAMESLIL